MEERKRKNPWLGLQSYQEGEILYGRDDDIRDLTQCVINDTDTLLYGKSGIGKSSILNAGILPAARRFGYRPFIVRLDHKEPQSYLSQIKAVIGADTVREVIPCKDITRESLYEFFHRHTFHEANGERMKLLIIFDQFEEIFTLQGDSQRKKQFFAELADQLNDIVPAYLQNEVMQAPTDVSEMKVVDANNFGALFDSLDLGAKSALPDFVEDNDIHFVFTIREDFLSEFEYFTAAIPSLKQNRYCLRPINDEQAAQIILRPIPGLITKPVAKLILEKVTGRTDFDLDGVPEVEVDSAVLSLYLNRLYDACTGDVITTNLVEQKGGEIIADFYSDAISELSDDSVEYLEDKLLNGQGRRENVTIFDALASKHLTQQEISRLCNEKKILRQFNYAGELRIELVHDILCPVVKAHKELRALLKEQEEERRRQEEENKRRLEEEENKRREVERKAAEEKEKLQAEAHEIRRRNRKRMRAMVLTLAMLALTFLAVWYLAYRPYSTYYGNITTMNGWPVGLGKELSNNEKKEMVVHYRLTRRGRLPSLSLMGMKYHHPYYQVEVLNGKGNPTTNKLMESPLVSLAETESEVDAATRSFAKMQLRATMWRFAADAEGNISRQTAYDIKGKVIYSIQYYRTGEQTDENSTQTLWMNYLDAEGKSLRVRGNGADRIRITMRDGLFVRKQFFSESGTPQRNSRQAYGYTYQYDPADGHTIVITPLDEYGDSISQLALQFTEFDKFMRWTKASNALAEYGSDYVIYTVPGRNDTLRFDENGQQVYRSERVSGKFFRTFSYDSDGNLTDNSTYSTAPNGRLVGRVTCTYAEDSRKLLERTEFNVYDMMRYRREVHEYRDSVTTISYYGGKSLSSLAPVNSPSTNYHQLIISEKRHNDTTEIDNTYRVVDESTGRLFVQRQERTVYNADSILWRRIVIDSLGRRTLSIENEIENGLIVGQHVMGLDGSIVRCPQWDDNRLCYYRKKFVRNFAGEIVATKAINEFGEESLITYNTWEIRRSVVPGDEIKEEGEAYTIYGVGAYKFSAVSLLQNGKVDYLHITDTTGTYYRCGLRDGDILLAVNGDEVKVARPLLKTTSAFTLNRKYYEILTRRPQEGEQGMEHYPVYFTETEMQHLQESLNSK